MGKVIQGRGDRILKDYETEKKFMIAEGDTGELYIFISAKKGEPCSPQIIYDGQDHAIFVRNKEQKIILDYIHPEVREKLKSSKEVVIVETLKGENIKDSYYTDIKVVCSIPLDWSLIGLGRREGAYILG